MSTVYFHTEAGEAIIHYRESESWVSQRMNKYPGRRHWFFTTVTNLQEFRFESEANHSYTAPCPGKYAVYNTRLVQVEDTPTPVLLVADLDSTLVGHAAAPQEATSRFADYWLKHHYFGGSKLVYNTGRTYQMFCDLYNDEHNLLDPDMIVTGVGHAVYTVDSETGEHAEHSTFTELYDTTHWNSEVIAALVREKFPWAITPKSMRVLPLKVWGSAQIEDYTQGFQELKHVLKNASNEEYLGFVYKAKPIVSNYKGRKLVDLVPAGGGKGMGLVYAQQYFGFENSRTLVAGDSGNDIDMFKGDHCGVVVGNFQQELGDWIYKKPRTNKYVSELYWADAVIEALERIK